MMRLPLFCVLACAVMPLATHAADGKTIPEIRIALVGDSTVAEGSGWGPAFAKLLTSNVECLNFARGGQSSKSFRDTKNWQKVLDAKPNYMLIQFGHNDQPGKGPNRETDPNTTYPENMARYVDEARAIGAEPVLVTSMARRTYQPDGKIRPDLGPYVDAVKKIAKEKNVPLIDLNGKSIALLEKIGPKEAAVFDPTTKDGKPDHTHLNPAGGEAMARIVAAELRQVEPKLDKFIAR